MEETWVDIKGYVGIYQISTFGRVKSLVREDFRGNSILFRFMKQNKNSKGYLSVGLCKEGFQIPYRVHRLVAQAFIPNPDNKLEVNHKDGNKLNNRVENLEWCTHKENMEHAVNIIATIPRGEKSGKTNLTDKDVLFIREYLKDEKYSIKKIAEIFNTTQRAVSYISSGQSWKHLLKDNENINKHRNAKGSKNAASKLTEEKVKEIKVLIKNENLTYREIASMFGVDRTIIGRIKNGTAWKYVV